MAVSQRRHQPTRCKVCGVHMSETRISKRGYCFEHGLALRVANNEQLERGSGPFYDHWLRKSYIRMRPRLVAMERRLDNAGQEG